MKGDRKPSFTPKPSQNDRVNNSNNNKNTDRPLSQVKCFTCGRLGHYAPDCPNKNARGNTGIPNRQEYVRAAHTAIGDDDRNVDGYNHPSSSYSVSERDAEENQSVVSQRESLHDDQASDNELIDVPYEDNYDNDYYSRESDSEHIYAMRVLDFSKPDVFEDIKAMTEVTPATEERDKIINVPRRKGTFKSGTVARARPVIPPEQKLCLITYTTVNGQDAWTLWDAGSTTTSITPSFTDIAKISAFPLLDPFTVQLGTVGSRAKITHGADVNISMPGLKDSIYVDICNLDRYDLVIGTPFMRKNKCILDFGRNVITINGKDIPALPYVEDIDPRLHRSRANDFRAD